MSERSPYDYVAVRVVPRIEREEFVNVGVVLFSRPRSYLHCLFDEDVTIAQRVTALATGFDTELLLAHLRAVRSVCSGDKGAGPIAQLTQSERFHWLSTHRSTAIQCSALHSGVCLDPATTLTRLFETLVDRNAWREAWRDAHREPPGAE